MILIITSASKPFEIPTAGVKTWHSAQNLTEYRWQEGKRYGIRSDVAKTGGRK